MISKEQVEHMARLARIELTEQEKEKFQKDLSSILDYIDKLNKVKTEKIEPISQVTGLESIVREDEQIRKEDRQETAEKITKQAPNKQGDYIKVPKILE